MMPGRQDMQTPLYLDPDAPIDQRVDDLVSRMTLDEKTSQLFHESPAIERLGVPAYNWWNEGLHGVARAGAATVFPQPIGLAATFAPERIHEVAAIVSDEARAKHHEFVRRNDRGIYKGLTYWSPNINIYRDPRWGRGHETFGEDPFLTAQMGVAFVKGLQGNDPNYLKVVATPKHFAVHSGPEHGRENFDAVASMKDLYETYLPAFKACVTEGKAASVMAAYNALNGDPCCINRTLLTDILRKEWGFDGYVVSDCGAIMYIHEYHKKTASHAESIASAVQNGCELSCGSMYRYLVEAIREGIISEEEITRAVKLLYKARFRLGMFDPEERVPYASIPYEINACDAHLEMSRQAARESCVLLKNEGGLLPLSKQLKSIAVIGPNADEREALHGNYHGTPTNPVTILDGIRSAVSPDTRIYYTQGCDYLNSQSHEWITNKDSFGYSEAVSMAKRADVVVLCLGLSAVFEGENGDAYNSDAGGDRSYVELPAVQQKLLEEIQAVGKPVVLVLLNGGPMAISWAEEHVGAILETWYPGEMGGRAVADILFGDYNPAGRLPVTFVRSTADLPHFHDYSMKNRTYRYIESEPLYPFGYGLSYTSFNYDDLTLSQTRIRSGESVHVSAKVTNTGKIKGDEVVQCYLEDVEATVSVPKWQLCGVKRVSLEPGETAEVQFELSAEHMALIDDRGQSVLEPGVFKVHVGGFQPDERSRQLSGLTVDCKTFVVEF